MLIVADADYDLPRLDWRLADLPTIIVGRVRSDRVYYGPASKRRGPTKGRRPATGLVLLCQSPIRKPIRT